MNNVRITDVGTRYSELDECGIANITIRVPMDTDENIAAVRGIVRAHADGNHDHARVTVEVASEETREKHKRIAEQKEEVKKMERKRRWDEIMKGGSK